MTLYPSLLTQYVPDKISFLEFSAVDLSDFANIIMGVLSKNYSYDKGTLLNITFCLLEYVAMDSTEENTDADTGFSIISYHMEYTFGYKVTEKVLRKLSPVFEQALKRIRIVTSTCFKDNNSVTPKCWLYDDMTGTFKLYLLSERKYKYNSELIVNIADRVYDSIHKIRN